LAAGFALLVNLALTSTLWWSELFVPGVRSSVWVVVVVVWGTSVLICYRSDRQRSPSSPHLPEVNDFAEAVDRYLRGDWFQSERVLLGLLREDPRDVDAGLMLATLLRRTGRLGEARRQLDRIERWDGWEKWELEIRRERELLQQESGQPRGDESETGTPPKPLSQQAPDAA
jgi:hypothetical protein